MDSRIHQDFCDMLSALNAEGVEYLLVGAHALAAHGLYRTTRDMDVWVRPTAENAKKVWRALAKFGAPLRGIGPEVFQDLQTIYQVGVAPFRVDVLTVIEAVAFDEAWERRTMREVSGIPVSVLSVPDLMKNKRAAGRPKDLADVAMLEDLLDGKPKKRRRTKKR